ncbi:MAG: PIG-L family deacetylase [Herpetosiphon sp.]
MDQPQPNPRPRRVLIVAPHPDDAEFMAGGTLAHWHQLGASIHFLLVTDGTAGSRDPNQTQPQLNDIRYAEQRAAAAVLGCTDVTFLGYPDGRVEASLELRWDIARVIRRVRPDVVITQDPNFRYGPTYLNHPDHQAVATATLAAIMPTANTRLAALDLEAEGLEPHDVREVYLSAAVNPTVFVPLSAEDLDHKFEALRKHHSQLGDWTGEQRVRDWASEAGRLAREAGFDCEFAERFAYVRLQPDEVPTTPDEGEAER